jgi:predicted GIY-YIG superfamily endonuclease
MSKRFVYVLKNSENPPRYYTGLTSDVASRCADHNAGRSIHTATYRPWTVDIVIECPDERRAGAFERYLNQVQVLRSRTATCANLTDVPAAS